MENLTKHQLILVALLISFVTSIATGIVTVSLMDQAPKGVTQTINRIVERTVERVVTEPKKAGETVKETIIVKEEDRIVEAIEKNSKSAVRIYKMNPSVGAEVSSKTFVGLGVIISKEGDIATDGFAVSSLDSYVVVLNNEKEYDAKLALPKENKAIAFLKIAPKEKETISLTPAVLADSNALKLGQTVISMGGKLRNIVSVGIITSFIEAGDFNQGNVTTPEISVLSELTTPTTTLVSNGDIIATAGESLKEKTSLANESKNLSVALVGYSALVETNIISNDDIAGNPFINLSSEVVGIRVKSPNNTKTSFFVPINEVKKSFSEIQASSNSSKQKSN